MEDSGDRTLPRKCKGVKYEQKFKSKYGEDFYCTALNARWSSQEKGVCLSV